MVPLITPEKVTSVTGGDVSTDTGPVAVVPFCVAVHVTLSAAPPPEPWPMTPDHVPVTLTGCVGMPGMPPHPATSNPIKVTTVRPIRVRIRHSHTQGQARQFE
jgi:hypothetical protein